MFTNIAILVPAAFGIFFAYFSPLTGRWDPVGVAHLTIAGAFVGAAIQTFRRKEAAGRFLLLGGLAALFTSFCAILIVPTTKFFYVYWPPALFAFVLRFSFPFRRHTGILSTEHMLKAIRSDDPGALRDVLNDGLDANRHCGILGTPLSPLGWCAKVGAPACARLLLERGADPEVVCGNGIGVKKTALALAQSRGDAAMTDALQQAIPENSAAN